MKLKLVNGGPKGSEIDVSDPSNLVTITVGGKRIDAVAVALSAGFTVEDLVNADLAYAPPFSPLWDPIQVAARKALALL